jgi:hypothetical protein
VSLRDLPVDDDERLARMIHYRKHIKQDKFVKADAFLPYKHVELSVVRHRELSESEIWEIGRHIAALRELPLLGRGDISAIDARNENLNVVPAEGPDLPKNHADIVGWPGDKPTQMLRAAMIAARATFARPPTPDL